MGSHLSTLPASSPIVQSSETALDLSGIIKDGGGGQMKTTMRAFLLVLVSSLLALIPRPSESSPAPIKYHCDMCETNWLRCIMNCHMEEYMTRHKYDGNQVYMGKPTHGAGEPKKNMLDKMFEQIMHSTGHEHMK